MLELKSKHTSQLGYMEGNKTHERDSLHFVVHDLQHMEHFVNPDIRDEQASLLDIRY